MADPIFFVMRRTARQVQLHAALSFDRSAGTFERMPRSHPRKMRADMVLNTLAIAAKRLGITRATTLSQLLEAGKQFDPSGALEGARIIPANSALPARIVISEENYLG